MNATLTGVFLVALLLDLVSLQEGQPSPSERAVAFLSRHPDLCFLVGAIVAFAMHY